MRTYKDGDQWCAVGSNFVNLQESTAGFGDTREDAIEQLVEELENELAQVKEREKAERERAEKAEADPRLLRIGDRVRVIRINPGGMCAGQHGTIQEICTPSAPITATVLLDNGEPWEFWITNLRKEVDNAKL